MDSIFVIENLNVTEPSNKRRTCNRCKRPIVVCWCSSLPNPKIKTKSSIYVWQHPYEEKRCLSTTPILKECLEHDRCHIWRGRYLSDDKFHGCTHILNNENTILLWPSPTSVDANDLDKSISYNIILIDGTWNQARSLYNGGNNALLNVKKVQINSEKISKYLIRTQPADNCLSTLETGAIALSILDDKPDLFDKMTLPLETLCKYQIDHGAVSHESTQKKFDLYNLPYKGYGKRRNGNPKWLRLLKETASLQLKSVEKE